MSVYVIVKKNSEFLDTPVFHAGESGSDEAIAAFSDREGAETYLKEAAWTDTHEAGELDSMQFLRWLVTANEQGTRILAVDPDRQRQESGSQQQVVVIEEKLAAFAETLTREILSQKAAS